jgi:hypothetical protein
VPLHHPRAAADHEPAGGLLRDRSRERGAGQFERAARGGAAIIYGAQLAKNLDDRLKGGEMDDREV